MSTAPNLLPRSSTPALHFPGTRPRHGLLALWHLLSLDAPTVATLWTCFLAHANHLSLGSPSVVAMAAAVWLLYALDRLLDARTIANQGDAAHEERHRFHHHHRSRFFAGIAAAGIVLARLVPGLPPASLHLYGIEGSFLAGYFLLIHATGRAHRLPKEIVVGLFFAAAVCIPTVATRPELRASLWLQGLLLACLCSLNCLFIYAWEHVLPNTACHPATRFALRHLRRLTLGVALGAAALAAFRSYAAPAISCAIGLAAMLLLLLDHRRRSLDPTTLRAAADLALLTPVLFLFIR